MMASSWALRLMNQWSVVSGRWSVKPAAPQSSPLATAHWPPTTALSLPVITHRSLLGHHFFEMRMLAHQHFAEDVVLPHLDRLQPDQFEQRQKYADQRLSRLHTAEHLLQPNGAIFEGEPAVQVLDHLADGYGLFVHFEDRPAARAVEDLLKRLDQVDDIGGAF